MHAYRFFLNTWFNDKAAAFAVDTATDDQLALQVRVLGLNPCRPAISADAIGSRILAKIDAEAKTPSRTVLLAHSLFLAFQENNNLRDLLVGCCAR